MSIESAQQSDASELLEIYAPHVLGSPASFETELPSSLDFAMRIQEYTKMFPWIVEREKGRIVAYAYASTHRSRCAYQWSVESSVYVRKEYQGKGIGKKLYEHLFGLLKKQGVINVFAGITLPNVASVALHESLGFQKIGQFKDIGYKLNSFWDVGWWQLQLQRPAEPKKLEGPLV